MENVQPLSDPVRVLRLDDLGLLYDFIEKLKQPRDVGYFEKCFALCQEGKREIFGIFSFEVLAGYCIYNRTPKYTLFQKLGIPEIQDLNVLPLYRGRGRAGTLIEHCENRARQEGKSQIGIGVGLAPSFGAAQRLYVKMGYIPDGNGVTYDRLPMIMGEMRPNDEHLSLMMVKNLG